MSVLIQISAIEAGMKAGQIPDPTYPHKKMISITTVPLYDNEVAKYDPEGVIKISKCVVDAWEAHDKLRKVLKEKRKLKIQLESKAGEVRDQKLLCQQIQEISQEIEEKEKERDEARNTILLISHNS